MEENTKKRIKKGLLLTGEVGLIVGWATTKVVSGLANEMIKQITDTKEDSEIASAISNFADKIGETSEKLSEKRKSIVYDNDKSTNNSLSGFTDDEKQLLMQLTEEANQGNVISQYNLGKMYYEGKGVQQNNEKAKEYLRMATAQNHAEAIALINDIVATEIINEAMFGDDDTE